MKFLATLAAVSISASVATQAAAHQAVIDHGHPHVSATDGALLGFDFLALATLVLAGAIGAGLALRRSRK